jgi:hypothetical protein
MRYFRRLLVAVFGAVSLLGAGSLSVAAHDRGTLVEFDSMTPVTGAAVGAVNDRGIKGGGLPWVITSGSGEVDRHGDVDVRVTGLIIEVAPVNGKNPIGSMAATISCVTPHGVVNVTTAGHPASLAGDVTIEDHVQLPHPCKDPIVFVVNAGTGHAWFAMSNSGDEEED